MKKFIIFWDKVVLTLSQFATSASKLLSCFFPIKCATSTAAPVYIMACFKENGRWSRVYGRRCPH